MILPSQILFEYNSVVLPGDRIATWCMFAIKYDGLFTCISLSSYFC